MEKSKFKEKFNEQNRITYSRKVRSKLPNLAKIIVLLLFVLSAFLVVTKTSLFDLEGSTISDEQGYELAYVDKITLKTFIESEVNGKNFFLFEPSVLKEKIISKFPYAKDVWIEKNFPNTISTRIKEKTPLLTVGYDNRCFVIDDEGYLIKTFNIGDVEEEGTEESSDSCEDIAKSLSSIYTHIEDGIYDTLFSGSGFFLFQQIYQSNALIEDLGMESEKIDIGDRVMVITLRSGRLIKLDPFEDFENQLKRMVLVFNQTEYQGEMSEIDLRYERPVVRE